VAADGCVVGCPDHHCHAWQCGKHVPRALLMCRRHWFMVPAALRAKVWATYRRGRERDKRPSREYLAAAIEAVAAVAEREEARLGR
jgi:hypothetical protein